MVWEDPAKSVRKPPGSMIVTLIPSGPTSLASTSEKPSTPHLAAAYAAAKWGVEGFSEVLAKEVGPLGIKVTIIEPGGFRTDFAGSSQTILADNPAYASTVGAAARFQREYDGAQPGDPTKAAAAVLNIARLDEPPMRLLLGRDAVRAAAEAERTRAEADRKWRPLSESTDFIDDAGQSANPASQSSSTGGRADLKSRTWLITGAVSGLAARYPDRALALALDVTNADQRAAAVQQTEQRFGAIDVLVNNAGIDYIGAIEEQEERDYRAIFEVNFFGAVSMLRLVLPGMRARKQGTIVNVSSMDGIASLPVNGFYSSSKFALEGLTESLWQEIEPIGLRAFLVELGSFRTGLADRTKFSGAPIEAYAATSGAFRKVMATMTPEMFPGDLVRAAEAIYEAVTSDRPRHWVILGSDAYRLIGAKLDKLRAEYDAGREMAFRTDYPGSAKAIL